MGQELPEGHKQTLLELLNQPVRELQEGQEYSPEELQEQRYLERMRELARGLVDSEYWDLVSVSIIEELEIAKGALESVTIGDKEFRIKQGEAQAYRNAFNKILKLAETDTEESSDGKE